MQENELQTNLQSFEKGTFYHARGGWAQVDLPGENRLSLQIQESRIHRQESDLENSRRWCR